MKVINLGNINLVNSNNEINTEIIKKQLNTDVILNSKSNINIAGKNFNLNTISLNPHTHKSLDMEINNIKRLNSNKKLKPLLLQYKYLIKGKDGIITIFEDFQKALKLKEMITKLNTIDNVKQTKITRYLISNLLRTLSEIHNNNVAHLQLYPENILIKVNENYDSNTDLYKNYEPLELKYINFNLNTSTKSKKYISANKINNIDPYLKDETELSLEKSKKFDLWCIGIIILKLVTKEKLYEQTLKDILSGKNIDNNVLKSQNFVNYFNNIKKYALCNLKDRQTPQFILNKTYLDEKHKDL